jgi:hypothetical protein
MCHQTVGLVQAALEGRGVVTTSISIMPEVTRKVGVPRALEVPFPLGFPVGPADDRATQRAVVQAALALTGRTDVPVLEPYQGSSGAGRQPDPDVSIGRG